MYENALTLKQSHSIDKNPKLIQERVALRKAIESHLDIKPIKEFGKNYAEGYHDGAFSIQKLLTEAKDYEARKEAGNLTKAEMEQGVYKGQVAGAFYKEGLGDIDLVWGDSTFGLAHILERRTQDFIKEGLSEAEARAKAMNFINSIPEIIEKGELSFGKNRAFIDFDNKRGLIALDYKGDGSKKWLITAYKEYDAPTSAKPHQSEHNIDTSSVNRIDGDKTNSTTNTAKRQEEVKEAVGNTVTQTQEQINSNLNKSLQEAQKIFKAYNKDKYNDKLFDKVIEVANSLGVRYWEQSNPKWVNGTYTYYLNRAMIDTKLFMFDQKEIAPTLLHELIHSTTSRALHLYDNGHKELLSKAQQEAIAELKDIYTLITSKNKDKQWISYADTKTEAFKNQNRIYGLKNEHEMLAELSNKDFRDFLKEQNIFVKIINAIKKFFGIEEKQADSISTNAFKELEQSLYKIIDNYENPQHFTSEFDRIYNIENFVDFDNYRKYIKDNYERFKEFKKPRDYYTHSDTPYAILVDDMFQKYNLDGVFEFRDTPLGEKLFEISKDKDKLGNILAIIEPFFKNNLQSTLSKEYVDNLLKNINEIKNKKNLIYNKKPVNDFFVSEYVLKEVEKLQHAQNAFSTIDKALLSKAQSKFKFDEKKASDLLEWHKNSSPITKDKNGLPKVFYHGSGEKFEVFEGGNDELGREGMYFSSSKKVAESYKIWDEDEVYSVFLNIKNPLVIDAQGNNYNSKFFMAKLREARESGAIHNHDGAIFKNIRDEMAQGNGELADTIVVFDSKQIKHIKNKGSYIDESGNITSTKPKDKEAQHKYFNEKSPNIYYSNQHIGTGLASGTLAGLETDEEGNVIGFDPQKFALGFLGGSAGSIAFKKGKDFLDKNPKYKEAIKKELADTLAKGWESASAKYPLLDLIVKPQYIMQNEKGRIAQAGHLLNKLENSHLKQAKEKLKAIDTSTLTKEQQEVLKVFLGEKSQTSIKGKDLKDIHTLEQGSRKKGAKKILIKHYGVEKTGGLSDDEILDISKVIKKGEINAQTFSEGEDFIRYGYDLSENGINYRVVVDEFNDGKKIFDYYSDRNFTDFKGVYSPELPNTQTNSTIDKALLSKAQSKFKFDEKKASDLLEWHKNSSPITKDKNGLPKVFYHGSGEKFEVFEGGNDELGREGMYFSSSKKVAESYKIWDEDEVYSVFLNIKNPLVIDAQGNNYNSKFFMAKLREARESGAIHNHDGAIFKNIRDEMAQGNGELADTIVVFDSKQIKHIKNKGSYIDESGNITSTKPKDKEAQHKYFNEKSPNIYYSNQHIGTGLASGTLAGLETDEEGNVIGFDPQKFALGFLGGSAGSIAFKKGKDFLDKNPKYKEAIKKELADTLAKGWESASAKYPLLDLIVKPQYIMQNEKGRIAQAGHLIKEVQEKFIQDNLVNEKVLHKYAKDLPNALNKDEFLAQIPNKDKKGYSSIQTPIGEIRINLTHAWKHLNKGNTYKKDRSRYSGAFLDTLTDPLLVVKQEYIANPKLSANAREMQNSKLVQSSNNESIAKISYAFFKPYHTQSGFNYMVGYALDIKGNIINTTFIPMGKKDLARIKKMLHSEILYFKGDDK